MGDVVEGAAGMRKSVASSGKDAALGGHPCGEMLLLRRPMPAGDGA
jgi:hypothetical protein